MIKIKTHGNESWFLNLSHYNQSIHLNHASELCMIESEGDIADMIVYSPMEFNERVKVYEVTKYNIDLYYVCETFEDCIKQYMQYMYLHGHYSKDNVKVTFLYVKKD